MNKSNNGAAKKRRWLIGGLAVAAVAAILWAAYRPRPLDVETATVAEGRFEQVVEIAPSLGRTCPGGGAAGSGDRSSATGGPEGVEACDGVGPGHPDEVLASEPDAADEEVGDLIAETIHDPIASFLAQTAMQCFSAIATAVEYLSELVDFVAGAAEHDGSVWGFDVEYPAERCRLVTPVDDVGNLTNERRAVAG